jgi:taurine dioxygenase
MERALEIHRLSPAIGVEVRGVDLSQPLSPAVRRQIRNLFDRHGLLLFRRQHLDEDAHVEVCRALRPVVDPVAWVSNVTAGFHPEGELLWHSDYAFTPHPMLGLSLYAIEVAPGAVPTRFANSASAVDVLPEVTRAELRGLHVVHCIDSVDGRDNVRTRLDDVGGASASTVDYPRFSRPAIWPHPVTGRPLLFVLEQQASHIEGMTATQSDPLLAAAFAALYDPSNVYEHHWAVGDLVVWDNLMLQHGRPGNPNTVRRSLRRVAMSEVTTADLIAGTGFDPRVRAERSAGS